MTIFVPRAVEVLLNSHPTQHLSASCLPSYEIILLTLTHIILIYCNPANLSSFFQEQNYLTLTDHLLTSHDDLQETPMANVDFSWFTESSYLKTENSKYCTRYAVSTAFEIIKAASLPLAISAQRTKLYTLTQACILTKGKITDICTDS